MRFAAVVLLSAVTSTLGAQGFQLNPRVQPEVRLDAAVSRYAASVAMAGANTALGYYVRAGAAVGAGVTGAHDGTALALRADATVRFLLDPFAEHRWGPYAGGGLTVRRDGNDQPQAGVLLVLGVEGRRARRWTPAVEVALGEGARLAVVLRKSRSNGR
jgi:hypothetical protein